MFGLFVENGPLMVDSTGQGIAFIRMKIKSCCCTTAVLEREVTWNKEHHMIYIDNPVKTGFSFTQVDKGLVTSEEQIAEYLYRYEYITLGPAGLSLGACIGLWLRLVLVGLAWIETLIM